MNGVARIARVTLDDAMRRVLPLLHQIASGLHTMSYQAMRNGCCRAFVESSSKVAIEGRNLREQESIPFGTITRLNGPRGKQKHNRYATCTH